MNRKAKPLQRRSKPILCLVCLSVLAALASGCSPASVKSSDARGKPVSRHFAMKEIDLRIVQEPGPSQASSDLFPTRFTFRNIANRPVCLLNLSIPDEGEAPALYASDTVQGSYFYRKGRLCVRLEDSEQSGTFLHTDALLLPGQTFTVERPLEKFGRRPRFFLVTYQIMSAGPLDRQVFAPAEDDAGGDKGKVYESIPQSRIQSLRDQGRRLGEIICSPTGVRSGFRCSVALR